MCGSQLRPSARQSMQITSVQVFLLGYYAGQGHHLLTDWVSGLSSFTHHNVLHGCAICVGGCGVPCQIVKLHPLQEILWADLVLGCDTAHPVDYGSVIVLQANQTRLKPRFHLYGTRCSWRMNCKVFLWRWWEVSGRWGWTGAHKIGPIWHGILWRKRVRNPHLGTSSPRGIRRMTPPQASPCPLWPMSLVCHLLVWPVPIHRVHLKLGSDFIRAREIIAFLVNPTSSQKMEFVMTPLRHAPQGSLSDFWNTSSPGPDIRTLVLPCWPEVPFLPC